MYLMCCVFGYNPGHVDDTMLHLQILLRMATPTIEVSQSVATSTTTRATSCGKASHLRAASRRQRVRHVTAHVDIETVATTNVSERIERHMLAATSVVTTATLGGTELLLSFGSATRWLWAPHLSMLKRSSNSPKTWTWGAHSWIFYYQLRHSHGLCWRTCIIAAYAWMSIQR